VARECLDYTSDGIQDHRTRYLQGFCIDKPASLAVLNSPACRAQCGGERLCCLLVLDSVTSTPQWIRQPKPRDLTGLSSPFCNAVAGCSRRFEQACGRFELRRWSALPLRLADCGRQFLTNVSAVSAPFACTILLYSRWALHACGRGRLCSGFFSPAVRTSQDSLALAGHYAVASRDEAAAGQPGP
jgi:hypothetical protein